MTANPEARARAIAILKDHGIEYMNGSMGYRASELPGDAILGAMLAFVARTPAAPVAGDMVMVPREPTRIDFEKLMTLWGYNEEETAETLGAILDVFATPEAWVRAEPVVGNNDLAACPFCGCHGLSAAYPRIIREQACGVVECHTDNCYAMVVADTLPQAIAAWNRRALVTPKPVEREPADGGEGEERAIRSAIGVTMPDRDLRLDPIQETEREYWRPILAALASPSVDREAVAIRAARSIADPEREPRKYEWAFEGAMAALSLVGGEK